MKAKAAAARERKKLAGTQSTKAAVRRLAKGGESSRATRESVRQSIEPDIQGKVMSKKKARRVHSSLRATQSQTHRAPR
jgi:hypothetical protein